MRLNVKTPTCLIASLAVLASFAASAAAEGLTPAQTGVVNKTAPYLVAGDGESGQVQPAACQRDRSCPPPLPRLPRSWHDDYKNYDPDAKD